MIASSSPLRLVTARDLDILAALDRGPLTAAQLLKNSRAFARPFTTERRVRERLFSLCEAGRLHRRQYAAVGLRAPNYYTLSPLGYRLLHGEDAIPPTKRIFGEVGIAKQLHTYSLAEFVVHTVVAARSAGIGFTGFHRENALRLEVGKEAILPDAAWQLILPGGAAFTFFLELDAGTERIRSDKESESLERKIRLYDEYQEISGTPFRVLVATVRESERLSNILSAAATLVRQPERSLFYGISLPRYLAEPHPLTAPCFRDHRGGQVALVRGLPTTLPALSPLSARALPTSSLPSLPTQALG